MAELTKDDICVLIPAYNEAHRLPAVLDGVKRTGFRAVVVDDGSTDGTADKVKALGAEVLSESPNRGKGHAIRRGIAWALRSNCRAVILMDADGQHDPSDLPVFLEALTVGRHALIVGSRMASPEGMPWVRRCTNRFMSWLLSLALGQNVPDTQSGYRALRRDAMEAITLSTDRFEAESEMLLEAARKGFAIGSVPIRCIYADEVSRVRPFRDTWRFFRFLWTYFWRRR